MSLEQQKKLRLEQRDNDLRKLVATAWGRRVFSWIIEELGGLYELSYSNDGRSTEFLEGRRAVALAIFREIQRAAPAHHVHMVSESLSRQQQEAMSASRQTESDDADETD